MTMIRVLSEHLIEILRQLSTEKRPLTVDSLGDALTSKGEILQLLTSQKAIASAEASNGNGDKVEEENQQLKAKLHTSRNNEDRLRKYSTELEGAQARLKDLLKKSIPTLAMLAQAPDNSSVHELLEELRSLTLKDAESELIERCVNDIKEVVLKEDLIAAKPKKGGSFFSPGKWLKSLESFARTDVSEVADSIFAQLQGVFGKLIRQLQTISNETQLKRFSELATQVASCRDLESLIQLTDEIVDLLKDFTGQTSEERSQMASFVKELKHNLMEVEDQFLSSMSDNSDSHRANIAFNDTLQGHMDGIEESFSLGKTIEETQQFVFSKLGVIKQALLEKRKQDEAALENASLKLEELQKNLNSMKGEIDRVQARTKTLEKEALIDSLTMIHNRRSYEQRIQEEFQRFTRYNQVFSLVIFDVDHFKQVNDRFGHRAGDRCLKEIINRIKPSLRNTDFMARYGGEEFVIIMPGTDKNSAALAAEKIRRLIEVTHFAFQGQEIPVTISLGIAEMQSGDSGPGMVFARADRTMYKAKKQGRNCVCVG